MNTRILELIENPQLITAEDLGVLEHETQRMPYAQSLRAIYLYGIHLYKPELYKESLTKTAAYTTDKKILYQFINSHKTQVSESIISPTPQVVENLETTTTSSQEIIEDKEVVAEETIVGETPSVETSELINHNINETLEPETIVEEIEEIAAVEEETNINDIIDVDTPQEESGIEINDNQTIEEKISEATDELMAEKSVNIIPEQQESVQKEIINEPAAVSETEQPEEFDSELSFNGITAFLPQVKFEVPKNHLDYLNPPKKETKQPETHPQPVVSNYQEKNVEKELAISELENSNDINFENIQAFEVVSPTASEENENPMLESSPANQPVEKIEPQETTIDFREEVKSEWKPMMIDAAIPDALIGKTSTPEVLAPTTSVINNNITETKEEEVVVIDETSSAKEVEVVEAQEENLAEETITITETPTSQEQSEEPKQEDEELPVLSVSFFGSGVAKIDEPKTSEPKELKTEKPAETETEKPTETVASQKQSNVGTFIKTWQSWLKIERPAEDPIKKKEKIIEAFIEKNPRISQLKEDTDYVVKEKKDDISHLMTETLARLYVEQKLYAKAIQAYEILKTKHPEKTELYNDKIEEIKEMRKPF